MREASSTASLGAHSSTWGASPTPTVDPAGETPEVDARQWLASHGGIAHRRDLARAGFDARRIRLAGLTSIGRQWVATEDAPALLRRAAEHGSPLTCITAATHLGIDVLEPETRLHLWRPAHHNARGTGDARIHRAALLGEHADRLVVPVLDLMAHAATCLPTREALVVWESALFRGRVSPRAVSTTAWRSRAARRLAGMASPLSESPLESALHLLLHELGLPFRQQVPLLGHRVDFLIGERLVIQTDGYEYHRDARQRRADIAHDALLQLHDMTPLRFDFVQVVRRTDATAATILAAVGRGLHR